MSPYAFSPIQVLSPDYLQLTGEQKIGEDPRDDVIQYVHYVLLHNKPPQIQWLTTTMYYAPDSALMWAVPLLSVVWLKSLRRFIQLGA